MLCNTARRPGLTPRLLAALVAAAGLLDLGSALTPALGNRLHLLQEMVGNTTIRFSQTATVIAGLCALMLARSLARRHRRAANLAMIALVCSAVLNVLKGLDFEEGGFCLAVSWLLWRARADFVVGALPISWRGALSRTGWLGGLCLLYAEAGAWLLRGHVVVLVTWSGSRPVPFPLAAFLGLWVDSPTVLYRGRRGLWFKHSLHVLLVVGVVYALVRLLRPLIPIAPASPDERIQARALLARYGYDSLCWFHLRRDRSYLFAPKGDGFVSYRMRGDVALLGGDPVCAPNLLRPLIRYALDLFAANGITPCVIGASAEAMRAYRAEGMHATKLGEEAVIPLPDFSVDRLAKRVRRAARAIAGQGIEIHIGTMADLDRTLVDQCDAVSAAWLATHGGVAQGFSMTSGPLPPPNDREHQVVLAAGPTGTVETPRRLLGFLTLAPAPAARALSLDHMRRVSDAPNGLTEALIIRAAEYFRDAGYSGISLNFAALSDKECPEGEGAAIRAARAAVFEGARYLPLRSLYRFNKKFDPVWSCRYALYPSTASLPAAVIATMGAEVAAPTLLPERLGAALRLR
ncbi:MAG: bifunctional lysylphosphatidylglycerol flippase/synthetase MprF [Chloroflexota bacterium]